jgi:rifampicin phosphotransferase
MKTDMPFTAPGPGSWQLDATHFPRAVTKLFGDIFPRNLDLGFRESAKVFGALLETLEFKPVNGFMYFTPRGVGAPKEAKGPPPKLIFKLLLHFHPEIRRRLATVRDTFANKLWRSELRTWDEERRPASIRAHFALQGVDLGALDGEGLLAHLARCRDHWAAMIQQHHRFDFAALLPVADFLAQTSVWTGIEPGKACALLRGSSVVSSGSSPELERLAAALRAKDQSLLDGGDSSRDVLASLRADAGELGAAARGWLDLVSHRLQNGLDISELTNLETPGLLVNTIRRALEGDASTPGADDRIAEVRDRVPAPHRAAFDELLTEARLVYRLRDERGLYSDIWAAGIMRRGLLEAGRRLVAKGKLERADLMVDASWDEIRALMTGAAGPSSATLAERAAYRAKMSPLDVPPQLGPESAGPPPFEWMPAHSARLEFAMGMGINGIFGESSARSDDRVVRGLGVSTGVFEGTARLVLEVNEFERLKKGDVLVTRATTAAFNVVLSMIGAIVTDRGGTLSHSAIVARECGIPAVVGSRNATRLIPDGARIRVDGDLGEAHIL